MTTTTTATITKGKRMTARFPGTCTDCRTRVTAGTQIIWSKTGGVQHATCADWREAFDHQDEAVAGPSMSRCGQKGGCEAHDGECAPQQSEYVFTPCWAGGRCIDAPCCGCGPA